MMQFTTMLFPEALRHQLCSYGVDVLGTWLNLFYQGTDSRCFFGFERFDLQGGELCDGVLVSMERVLRVDYGVLVSWRVLALYFRRSDLAESSARVV